MRGRELTIGRTFAVTMEHGEDLLDGLAAFCESHGVRQAYLPMFLGAFRVAEVVGTCEPIKDPEAPVWARTRLERVEVVGCGTVAHDGETNRLSPHIHASLGVRERGASGFTSHLFSATVQFLIELVLVEITAPRLARHPDPARYGIPMLRVGPE